MSNYLSYLRFTFHKPLSQYIPLSKRKAAIILCILVTTEYDHMEKFGKTLSYRSRPNTIKIWFFFRYVRFGTSSFQESRLLTSEKELKLLKNSLDLFINVQGS